MTQTVYSQRLGAITDAQFQAALDHFDLGRLIRAEAIPYGLFGQNVFLTSTAGEFVLRGDPHFDWQFPTEQFHAEFLHERAAMPTPIPYQIDHTTEIFGWSYAIMPRMPGLQLADPAVSASLSDSDRLAIARTVGATLAQFQQATNPIAGRYHSASGKIEPFDRTHEIAWPLPVDMFACFTGVPAAPISASERAKAVLRWHLHSARAANPPATPQADVDWVEGLIDAADRALNDDFEPCFVHQDYKLQNLVVSHEANGWQVTGLFDLMEGYFGDGEVDLSRQYAAYLNQPEGKSLAREFLYGYLSQRAPRPGFEQRFIIYMLLDRMFVWDYFQSFDRAWRAKHGSFREWVSPYLSLEGML